MRRESAWHLFMLVVMIFNTVYVGKESAFLQSLDFFICIAYAFLYLISELQN